MKKGLYLIYGLFLLGAEMFGQVTVKGKVISEDKAVPYAVITVKGSTAGAMADSSGRFTIPGLQEGKSTFVVKAIGYLNAEKTIELKGTVVNVEFILQSSSLVKNEVVITGTLSEVSKSDSPIPVEVYTPQFLRKNPTPNLFESVGIINGVRPQLNCNVCNTGDIHINGMEGPYTMVLIDGMPIVSSLSTVYGLMGIPNSLVERIEVVKGPASSLYGSEAMGGLINVITRNPLAAPRFSADFFGTSWQEYNLDLGFKTKTGKKGYLLSGVNYFNSTVPADHNADGFTDVALQHRISLFSKWSADRAKGRLTSIAGRYVYEDRWGGEMDWERRWRGTDSVYGESIYTSRLELIGAYQLPVKQKVMTNFSWNYHDHQSAYGTTIFNAIQQTAFGQIYMIQPAGLHELLGGLSYRFTRYDDNTAATQRIDGINRPAVTNQPGIFVQDEWMINEKHRLLSGYRFDYDDHVGAIHSPRLAWKYTRGPGFTLRASFGTGFRTVNLFTEDHAALTGAREVVVAEALDPERSLNGNINLVSRRYTDKWFGGIDATIFYTYFTNKIVGDYNIDPDKIIYDNLDGYAVSSGVSLNSDITFSNGLRLMAGASYMNVFQSEKDSAGIEKKEKQLFAPQWSGTFSFTYTFRYNITADLTGAWNGPMRLPVLPNDFRPEYSPWFCLANIQLTKKIGSRLEIYGGVKNILNFVPKDPIMRAFDPFDKHANDPVSNPYGYTFDPTYNYAPLQGIRGFAGLRYTLR
jgi:outer membrane receptor for ferrienterochelin and colicins